MNRRAFFSSAALGLGAVAIPRPRAEDFPIPACEGMLWFRAKKPESYYWLDGQWHRVQKSNPVVQLHLLAIWGTGSMDKVDHVSFARQAIQLERENDAR